MSLLTDDLTPTERQLCGDCLHLTENDISLILSHRAAEYESAISSTPIDLQVTDL
jgi:hypothetical protein